MRAADTLEGDRIVNLEGDHLGTIEEIVIDVASGAVEYALVAAAGGDASRLLPIPWSALKERAPDGCFLLDPARATLAGAPDFARDQWPSMADPAWSRTVHHFYGVSAARHES